MLDAYAVRKAIPRVVLAVIGINLSIYLCIAAIDLTTIVGNGLNYLLVTPFIGPDSFEGVKTAEGVQIEPNFENNITGVLGLGVLGGLIYAVFASGGIGVVAIAVLGLLLPLIITIALIALAVLFTLIIRQGLLVFLTIISPIAIACYVLPGTEKYFKQWWDLFFKTLLVYPIIAAIFAMSNVLGAILISSAGWGTGSILPNSYVFAQSSDAIGTLKIIVAIMVLYAPLVLIPFAFKLAGGAIAAVMNAASGRAASFGGRAGEAIRKNRADSSSFLGSRKQRAFENRRSRGLTGDQIMTGVSGGISSRLRGGRFRTGYAAATKDRNESLAWRDSDRLMEDHDYKMIAGNDDALYALQHGRNAADVSAILRKRGYTDERKNAETTAAVMRAKSKAGDRAIAIAAARSQPKTGTAHEDEYDFFRALAEASGGNKNVLGRLVAEARGSAVQAGRIDQGGASWKTSFDVASAIMDDPNYTRDEANATIQDSVVESQGGSMLLHPSMKPQAARAAGKAWQRKVQRMRAAVEQGKATDADLIRTMAQAAGQYEAMNGTSPQNAKEFSNEFMGTQIDVSTLSPNMQKELAQVVSNNGGDTVLTMGQIAQGLRTNSHFQTIRKEFQDSIEIEEKQRQAAQQAQQAQQQGQVPTGAQQGPPTLGT